jgi:hypothetical protein
MRTNGCIVRIMGSGNTHTSSLCVSLVMRIDAAAVYPWVLSTQWITWSITNYGNRWTTLCTTNHGNKVGHSAPSIEDHLDHVVHCRLQDREDDSIAHLTSAVIENCACVQSFSFRYLKMKICVILIKLIYFHNTSYFSCENS